MKRTIPKCLVQRQEKTRKDTVEMVTQAILVLESQGYNIKIKDLISVTGLSRSVFAKPHIREVLVEYGIIQTQTPEKTAGAESTRRMDRLIAEKNGYIQRAVALRGRTSAWKSTYPHAQGCSAGRGTFLNKCNDSTM